MDDDNIGRYQMVGDLRDKFQIFLSVSLLVMWLYALYITIWPEAPPLDGRMTAILVWLICVIYFGLIATHRDDPMTKGLVVIYSIGVMTVSSPLLGFDLSWLLAVTLALSIWIWYEAFVHPPVSANIIVADLVKWLRRFSRGKRQDDEPDKRPPDE